MNRPAAAADPRTPCAPTDLPYLWAARVHTVLSCGRYDLANEKATQAEIEADLVANFGADHVSREHRLSAGDIPDFLTHGAVAVEIKGPHHRGPAVERQLARYAAHPEVKVIILVTARAMTMPPLIGVKPVRVINLGRAWL